MTILRAINFAAICWLAAAASTARAQQHGSQTRPIQPAAEHPEDCRRLGDSTLTPGLRLYSAVRCPRLGVEVLVNEWRSAARTGTVIAGLAYDSQIVLDRRLLSVVLDLATAPALGDSLRVIALSVAYSQIVPTGSLPPSILWRSSTIHVARYVRFNGASELQVGSQPISDEDRRAALQRLDALAATDQTPIGKIARFIVSCVNSEDRWP
jgi:hypothetical protein